MTFWKTQNYEEGKKLSGYRACRRGNGLKKQSTEDFGGSEITLCDTLNGECMSLYHMLKLTEGTISRVKPKSKLFTYDNNVYFIMYATLVGSLKMGEATHV